MSSTRRSFPGIAEAWIARGDGIQQTFAFNAKTIEVLCSLDFLGDVIDFKDISAFCELDFLGDVNPIISLKTFCVTTVSG